MNFSPQDSSATEREIFLAALEQATPASRAAFLDQACHGNTPLRERLEQLFHENDTVGDFLERPAVQNIPSADASESSLKTENPGDFIGHYQLLETLGEGGCGVVYMAEQQEPVRRRVALKVIKLGMDTRNVIARFEAERQALALMDHPNIARVLDAGATENGRPFFAMELVHGIKITDFCNERGLNASERLKLFIQVCQAIQHAHQKGIIHRDLKPSNILVTLHDGLPVPKVIDFGIAKATEQRLTEKTLFTEYQSFMGTPAYMSPEQAEMSGMDIDTRADIYALGVLLYELLVGKTPFDSTALVRSGIEGCRRTICDAEPARPSTRLEALPREELTNTAHQRRVEPASLIHFLKGDLDWIAMKCLEKDRRRRYETASDLASDIQRYLDNEPVQARPPSAAYRFQKFARRNRVGILAGTLVTLAILSGTIISTWQAIRATNAEHLAREGQQREKHLRHEAEMESTRAREEKRIAQLNEYIADINLSSHSLDQGNLARAKQLLAKHRAQTNEEDIRGFEWHYLGQLCQGNTHIPLDTQPGSVESMACSPDGKTLAIGLHDSFSLYDLASKKMVTNLSKGAVSMEFFPNGKYLATASRSNVRIWRTSDWAQELILPDNYGPITISPDGMNLATISWEGVRIWNTNDWSEPSPLREANGPLAFSPDGKLLATDSRKGVLLWDVATSNVVKELKDSSRLFLPNAVQSGNAKMMVFTPDGKSLVTVRVVPSPRGVFVLSVWDVETGNESAVLPSDPEKEEHSGIISSMAFNTSGKTLASASWDHSIRLWDFATGRRAGILQGHLNEVWAVTFTPDGRYIASGSKDGDVFLWPIQPEVDEFFLPGNWNALQFTPDNRHLVVESRGKIGFLNLITREMDHQFEVADRKNSKMFYILCYALSQDTHTLAWTCNDDTIQVNNTETGQIQEIKLTDKSPESLLLSPNGKSLLVLYRDQPAVWWDLTDTPRQSATLQAQMAQFSPDGSLLAVYEHGKPIRVLKAATRELLATLGTDAPPFFKTAFSPDGSLIATLGGTNSYDNSIHLWNSTNGRHMGNCYGHKQAVTAIAFSQDGKTLASAGNDSTVRFWNIATRQELLSVSRLGTTLTSLVFSPNGQMLAGASTPFSQQCGLRLFLAPSTNPPPNQPPDGVMFPRK